MISPELDIVKTYIHTHPNSVARDLELLPVKSARTIIDLLSITQAQDVLFRMLPTYAARLCQELPDDISVRLLTSGNPNQVAAILRCYSNNKRSLILKQLPDKTSILCRLLLSYSITTVGAWMIADTILLPDSITASDAIKRLSSFSGYSHSDALPIVNPEKHLIGFVGVKKLLRSNPKTEVVHLSDKLSSTLSSRLSLESAERHDYWQYHGALAVTNRHQQVIGMIRHSDLRRGIEQHETRIKQQPLITTNTWTDFIKVYLDSISALFELVVTPREKMDRPPVKKY